MPARHRYYFHGDFIPTEVAALQAMIPRGDGELFYCSKCDAFEFERHFTEHGADEESNHKRAIRSKKYPVVKNGFHRPKDARNLFLAIR